MTHPDPKAELLITLEAWETALDTPVVSGELQAWMEQVQSAWQDVASKVEQHAGELHPRQLKQIADQDPELIPQVEKLKAEDEEIQKDRESLERRLSTLAEHAPDFEPNEEKIKQHVEALAKHGISFVNRVRKQEVALDTWFMEAFQRDRGVAD